MKRISLYKGDITTLKLDAIVNAANRTLLGGGGVDGAIHREAGYKLLEECRMLNGCETGEAKFTRAYQLPAKYVIHTVGPVWSGGNNNENELLLNCYRNSLAMAVSKDLSSIAFPNISTGVYMFPKKLAATIAVSEVQRFLKQNETLQEVVFCVFDEENLKIYKDLLA